MPGADGGKRDTAFVKVWGLLVRIGHWALVIGITATWLTHGKWHEWLGYGVLAVVTLRIVWGFTGRDHARFARFVRTPAVTLRYGQQLIAKTEPRHIGHNPLGGWMIVTLLATITAICVTGWLYTTDRFWGEAWMENLHTGFTNVLMGLVALHIAGVIFSSLRHAENLVAAMLHGKKRAPGPGDIS